MEKSHNRFDEFPKEQVRSAIQMGIAQAEEQMKNKVNTPYRNRKNNRKRKVIYGLGSVAAAFGLLIGSSYYSPVLASNLSQIPLIGSVFGDSDLIGLQQAQKKGLTTEVGETQTINGISVTLDEILYDQTNITIGLIIETEKELGENYFGAGMDFTIDGELPDGSSGGYKEESQSATATTKTAIQTITVTDDMPNAFELGLILHGENGENWYFSTPIKKITDMKKVPIHHSQNVDGIHLTVTELAVSDTGVSVSFESSEEKTDFEQSRAGDIEFRMVDQNGNEITSHYGGVEGKKVKDHLVYKSNKQFDPIDSTVTELTITPYIETPTGKGGEEYDQNGKSKEIELKGVSSQKVEFESFKVNIPK